MPRRRSKPTDPNIKAAAVETARSCLSRLTIDVVSWSELGMGPTDGAESRRKHAIAFLDNALDDDAPAHIKQIARKVALPIATQETADGRSGPNARRNQILIDTIQLICKEYHLKPTRRSGEGESGCSIVAEALPSFLGELSEERLNNIWDERTR
jgi:hypothetical protein